MTAMTTELCFQEYPKTPRLNKAVIVTEKIDGTNAAVIISDNGEFLGCQSRSKLITPGKLTDNHGFAAWAYDNSSALAEVLGPGRHFGEWWGKGIQRGYGIDEKRFSLFNVHRWGGVDMSPVPNLGVVPQLGSFSFEVDAIKEALSLLRTGGSKAAPGFMDPEGVILYHTGSRSVFKVLLDDNDKSKSLGLNGKGGAE